MIHRRCVFSPTFAAVLSLAATGVAASDTFPTVTLGLPTNLSSPSGAPRTHRYDSIRMAQGNNVVGTKTDMGDPTTVSTSLELEAPAAAGVPDGNGGHIVVWEDARNALGGYSTPRDLRLQRLDSNGNVQWGSAGVVVCGAPDAWNNRTPSLATDGAGGVIVAWRDNRLGYNHDIYAQHVTSNGVPQWLADGVPVCSASGVQGKPLVVPDGTGGAILSWDDARRDTSTDIYAQHLTSTGQMLWASDGALIKQSVNKANSWLSMIADGSGGAIVCWVDYRASNFDIYAQRFNSSGAIQWTANGVAVCAASGSQTYPTPVSDNAGGAVIVWEDSRTGPSDVYAQRVGLNGNTLWTTDGVAVCTAASAQIEITAVPDGAGGALIAWADYRGGTWSDIYAQRLNSSGVATWTSGGVSVCGSQNDQLFPAIVADGSGGAFLAWSDQRNGYFYDIFAQYLSGTGTPQWSANGFFVCSASGSQLYPSVQLDGAGGMIVSWDDPRSGLDIDRYAQRLNSSGTRVWSSNGAPVVVTPGIRRGAVSIPGNGGETLVAWTEKRGAYYDLMAGLLESTGQRRWAVVVASTPTVGSHLRPALVTDGSGGAIVAWENQTYNAQYSDIYAQRVTHDGVCAWAANGVPVCSAIYDQTVPCIVSDGGGGAVIAWQDRRAWSHSDIYTQRLDANGARLWTENGVALCTAVDYQWDPVITTDGAGGAIVAWEDWRSLSSLGINIYARRVTAAGSASWTSNGVVVCNAPEHQSDVVICSDGAGGAIMAWADFRNGMSTWLDIYAQRLNASGTRQWAANGIAIANYSDTQYNPSILADGSGGAFIAWENYACFCVGPYDIYAQHVNSSGTKLWTTTGVAVCTADNDQLTPRMVLDGASGVYVTWTDLRSAEAGWLDVYCQRVDVSGAPIWAANGVPVSTAAYNQAEVVATSDGSGGVVLVWADSRSGNGFWLFGQRLNSFGALLWSDGTQIVAVADGPPESSLSLKAAPSITRGGTSLRYAISLPGRVRLAVFDVTGRIVRTLLDNVAPFGVHTMHWDGRDDAGVPVRTGLYFVQVLAGGRSDLCRVVVLH